MSLSPGDKLGPYEVLAPLGAGGMGEVWKARDTRLGRIVAIKQLKGQHAARFEQEARAIASLNHPHICQIHDIGPDYLVLEYIEGQPLKGPIPAEEAVKLALQIAGALEEAHAHGILHRDLKPGNILLTAKGAKLLDFGLAKLTGDGDATQTIGVSGTPVYMSPEQAEGKPLDARSDIFSFGAVLYQMLAGNRAFESLAAVLRDEPSALDAPPDLRSIVARCLRKAPEDRFASAAEVRIALEKSAVKPAGQQPSIAVLPFANMSRDADDEYFSDGLAEEIINALAQVPGLKVTARTSAFAFRGKEQDIRGIAEALGVRTVLEGSVRRAGNRIRVSAQLINATDGYHLWSERYDRELTDVFEIQDDISQAIATALQVALSGKSEGRHYTPAFPAYEAYLKGRQHQGKNTAEALIRSQEFFHQAIALDPNYAEPHAGLAEIYQKLAIEGVRPAPEVVPKVRVEARKALALNASHVGAQALLGCVAAIYEYDWHEAERIWAAIPHNGDAMAVFLGMDCLLPRGKVGEVVELLQLGVRQDPLNALLRTIWAFILNWTGMQDKAIEEVRKVLAMDEGHYFAHFCLADIHAAAGRLSEALREAERAYQLAPWHARGAGTFAGLLTRTGNQARAEDLIRQLQDSSNPHGVPMGMICYHLTRGDPEASIEWFEKAVQLREPLVLVYLNDPRVRPVKSSTRWAALMRLMDLPETFS